MVSESLESFNWNSIFSQRKTGIWRQNLLTYFRHTWFMPCKCLFLFIKRYSSSYSPLPFSEVALFPQNVSEKFNDVFFIWRIREDLKINYFRFGYISQTDERDLPYFWWGKVSRGKMVKWLVYIYIYVIPKMIWILILHRLNFLLRWFKHNASQKLLNNFNSSSLPSIVCQILSTCKWFSDFLNSTAPHFCL